MTAEGRGAAQALDAPTESMAPAESTVLDAFEAPTAVDALEQRLGDPFDDANPVGFAALLRADERGEMCAAGERALDEHGLNADFVPIALGGRLSRIDDLVAALRAVYRRDPAWGSATA